MNRVAQNLALLLTFVLAPQPAVAVSIVNGGFEEPPIENQSAEFFPTIPGWTANFGGDIEIQNNVAGSPHGGSQFVELDSFENSGILQSLATLPGQEYRLSFFYSPRPGYPQDTNGIEVFFDGLQVASIAEDGTELADTNWSLFTYVVVASGSNTPLEFRATGISDALGGYVDDVQFVPEPSTFLIAAAALGLCLVRRRRRAGNNNRNAARTNRRIQCRGIALAISICAAASAARGESVEWTRQLGSNSTDFSYSVSADGLGNVYISGYITGSLGGGPYVGSGDAFVSKYDAAGTLQWSRQLGTSAEDISFGVSADGLGNVYFSGYTGGSLGGPFAGGTHDAFVSKYDAAGTLQWSRQLGTSAPDYSNGVSADGLGNVYISGYTYGSLGEPSAGIQDAFVSKYDAAGNFQWTRQLGTNALDISYGVSADGLGNVYISGHTNGSLGGPIAGSADAFVSKYDAAGNFQWTRQLGTNALDISRGVSADGLGNVYISGYTNGSLGGPNATSTDAFVSKYDAAGNFQWTQQLGTSSGDLSYGVSADGLGNVYLSGYTFGSLGGPYAGLEDAFVSKYDAAGNFQWSRQLGTSRSDIGYGVSADGLGNVYISGGTLGSLGGPNAGSRDAFVVKIVDSVVPEPSTFLLAAAALAGLLLPRRVVRRRERFGTLISADRHLSGLAEISVD